MLDLGVFRAHGWGDPRIVRESQRRRRADTRLVETVVRLDREWRDLRNRVDESKRALNECTQHFKRERAMGEPERERIRALKASAKPLQEAMHETHVALMEAVGQIGNVVHQDVPCGEPEGPATSEQLDAAIALLAALPTGSQRAPAADDHLAVGGAALAALVSKAAEAGFELQDEGAPAGPASAAGGLRGCARALALAERAGKSCLRGAFLPAAAEEPAAKAAPVSAQLLPARHAFLVDAAGEADGAGAARTGALVCAVVAAGNSSASWRELESLSALAAECARELGLADVCVRDVPAHELAFEAARAYAVYAGPVVFACCTNHVDFVARAQGWKQAASRQRDLRTPETRFVHTLTLAFAPAAVLGSLAAGAGQHSGEAS